MSRRGVILLGLAGLAALGATRPAAALDVLLYTDPRGDAAVHGTSQNPLGPLNPAGTAPDLVELTLSGWRSDMPATDPYVGQVQPPQSSHLFRLELRFAGLINPPGPLQGGSEFDPYRYGPSPLYGFLELDMDRDRDTGGELGAPAATRYLANVGRFGRLPDASILGRAAKWGVEVDGVFATAPQYERSGCDFLLSLCGCYPVSLVSEAGNGNGIFESGETFVVRSAFFQRAGGYKDGCFSFGGVSIIPGMYDPWVNLRFSHNAAANETTVTLVYALDMEGAAQLAGESTQPMNYSAADHTSVAEGLQDIIDGVPFLPTGSPVWHLARRWEGREVEDALDPTRWRAYALFGSCYQTPQSSNFIWTDTGVEEVPGDMTGDGIPGPADAAKVLDAITEHDAGPWDGDGFACENQSIRIVGFGENFCAYDVDGDGIIDLRDIRYYCVGDFNRDGQLNVNDFIAFAAGYAGGDPRADTDHNGRLDVNDFVGFGNAFAGGCP